MIFPNRTVIRVEVFTDGKYELFDQSGPYEAARVPEGYEAEVAMLLAAAGRLRCMQDEFDIDDLSVYRLTGVGCIHLYPHEGPLIRLVKKPEKQA